MTFDSNQNSSSFVCVQRQPIFYIKNFHLCFLCLGRCGCGELDMNQHLRIVILASILGYHHMILFGLTHQTVKLYYDLLLFDVDLCQQILLLFSFFNRKIHLLRSSFGVSPLLYCILNFPSEPPENRTQLGQVTLPL